MSKKEKDPECIYYRLTFAHDGMKKKYDCDFFSRHKHPQAFKDTEAADFMIEEILNELGFDWRHCYASPGYPISKFIRSTENYKQLEKKLMDKIKHYPVLFLESFTEVEFHWKNVIRQLPYWKFESDPEAKKWIYL